MRTEEVRLANALSEMQISTKILAQFPKNWSHGNMHGLHEISGKTRGPTLEFNSRHFINKTKVFFEHQ